MFDNTHVEEVSYTPDTEVHNTANDVADSILDFPDTEITDLELVPPKQDLFIDTTDLFHLMDQASDQLKKSAETLSIQKQKKKRTIGHLIARIKLQELTQMDGETIFEKYHSK